MILLSMSDYSTNRIPIQCHLNVTVMPIKPHNTTQITFLPMNDHSNNPIPTKCHLTVTLMQMGPNNTTQICLMPMNDHSTNPIPIQCHLTDSVTISQSNTNPVQPECDCDTNQTTPCHSDFFTTNE